MLLLISRDLWHQGSLSLERAKDTLGQPCGLERAALLGCAAPGMFYIILVGCWLPFSRERKELGVVLAPSCSAAARGAGNDVQALW